MECQGKVLLLIFSAMMILCIFSVFGGGGERAEEAQATNS